MQRSTYNRLGWAAMIMVGVAAAITAGWPKSAAPRAAGARSSVVSASANPPTYPPSRGSLPASIRCTYLPEKDRTEMTLTLSALSVKQAAANHVTTLDLVLVSKFAGQTRAPDAEELSIQCTARATCGVAGALAPSSPAAEFEADGLRIRSRAAAKGESGYTSKAKSGTVHEALEFKLRTGDLLAIINAKRLTCRLGGLSAELTAAQVADLREFAARLKPGS